MSRSLYAKGNVRFAIIRRQSVKVHRTVWHAATRRIDTSDARQERLNPRKQDSLLSSLERYFSVREAQSGMRSRSFIHSLILHSRIHDTDFRAAMIYAWRARQHYALSASDSSVGASSSYRYEERRGNDRPRSPMTSISRCFARE